MSNLENEQSRTLLEFSRVRKLYGPTIANDDLSFAVRQGSIHAIIGENGAGKTTAMKILFGLEKPTSGQILFNGKPRPWTDARGALYCGIGMVHQHFMLSGRHTALDNVILGQENLGGAKRKTGERRWQVLGLSSIDRQAARNKLESLAQSVGFKIPWEKLVEEIPVGVQQQLEIMKLLYAGVDTMIFDEPTAVLSPLEKEKFLELLLGLRAEGKTIVVITHKLQEVKKIADVVTVFRRGKSIATRNNSELTIQDMADLMVGRAVSLGELPRANKMYGESLLSLSNFSASVLGGHRLLRDIEFSISSGQIVGIAGVEGSGQKDIWDYICGPRDYVTNKKIVSGDFKIFGKSGLNYTRGDVRKQPVAIIPADRLKDAVLASQNLLENDLLGHDHDFFTAKSPFGRWIDRAAALRQLEPVLKDFDVRPPVRGQSLRECRVEISRNLLLAGSFQGSLV